MNEKWKCPKCENDSYDIDEIRTTGGALSKFFNVQNKKFTAVSCTKCRYTEFYKGKTSTLGNIIDFFGN
jgi:hypothetical protein